MYTLHMHILYSVKPNPNPNDLLAPLETIQTQLTQNS